MVPHHRPEVADDRVDAFGAEDARKPLGRGVNALQTAFGLAGKGFLDGFDFGMYHRQFALEEGWAAENQVFAPHFDPFFDPFDSLEPDQFGHAAAVVHDGRETSFAPRSGIADACDAPPELDECGIPFRDLVDAVDPRTVDVAERIVAEHIAQRADAQLLFQQPGPRLAYARDEFDVVVEIVRHIRPKYRNYRSNTFFVFVLYLPIFSSVCFVRGRISQIYPLNKCFEC